MAAPYQTYPPYPPYPVYDNGQQADGYYPYDYHDRARTTDTLDPMERTAQYVDGINPDISSHHHHHHHGHSSYVSPAAPPLTIRRHARGADDPSLQTFPTNLQPSSTSDNISSSSNLRVTIKRNPIVPEPDQTFIQPVLYPVAVYVNSPVPQNFDIQPIHPVPPIKEITKPPSPKKPPSPPPSSSRYETESFALPPPPPPSRTRKTNVTPRRPIRTDLITPTPPKLEPQRIRPAQVIVEEYEDYNDYYRVPSVYTVPKKVVSYRTRPGLTTREVENEKMEDIGESDYLQSPPTQVVTYRTS